MAVFHFCFDLAHARVTSWNFYGDPVWTTQRTVILSMFLLCAGAGQAIASHQGQSWSRFWKRWAQVAACALLVSLGSWVMFPQSYIYFGVLHGMAVMLIMARLMAPLGTWLWGLGAICLLLPQWIGHPWFDSRWTSVIGLVTQKPITEDFVPVLPWFGVMCWGLAATRWLLHTRPQWLSHPTADTPTPMRWLTVLGQWSLTFYMLHQPIMIGLLEGALMIWRTP
jgi:uncharacterized membrane protein